MNRRLPSTWDIKGLTPDVADSLNQMYSGIVHELGRSGDMVQYATIPTSTGINNAITKLTTDVGVVILPLPLYTANTTITMRDGLIMIGMGARIEYTILTGTVIQASMATFIPVIDWNGSYGAHAMNFAIQGNATASHGIKMAVAGLTQGPHLRGIKIWNFTHTDSIGWELRGCIGGIYEDVYISECNAGKLVGQSSGGTDSNLNTWIQYQGRVCTKYGARFTHSCTASKELNPRIESNVMDGLIIEGANGLTIDNGYFENNATGSLIAVPTHGILTFTSGSRKASTDPGLEVGDTITGAISGSTAIIQAVHATSGWWADGTMAGDIYISDRSAAFQAENLNVGTDLNVATIAADWHRGMRDIITYRGINVDANPGGSTYLNHVKIRDCYFYINPTLALGAGDFEHIDLYRLAEVITVDGCHFLGDVASALRDDGTCYGIKLGNRIATGKTWNHTAAKWKDQDW